MFLHTDWIYMSDNSIKKCIPVKDSLYPLTNFYYIICLPNTRYVDYDMVTFDHPIVKNYYLEHPNEKPYKPRIKFYIVSPKFYQKLNTDYSLY
jgi:hypothetical protein